MRQCEYKRRYDPEIGQYVKEHIYGEGVFDSIRSFGSKLFGKKSKKAASKAVSKASEHAEENWSRWQNSSAFGEKEKHKTVETPSILSVPTIEEDKPLSGYKVYERVNQLLSSGKLRNINSVNLLL